jgi:hypothetical protein
MRQKSELLRQVWRLLKAFSILKKPINTIALEHCFIYGAINAKRAIFARIVPFLN